MKLLFSLLLISWVAFPFTYAQNSAGAVVELPVKESFPADQTALLPIPLPQIDPFLAYSVEWEGTPGISLQIRFYESEGDTWGEWLDLEPNPHLEREAPSYHSHLGFAPAASTHYSLRITPVSGVSDLKNLRCHFYSPGKSIPQKPETDEENRLACPCPIPDYLDRDGWCPSGNCPEDATPQPTTVTHLIVHHSAGSNTSSDWAARVRSIWNYHVNSNGWDDIGYNWLIDPNGVLYQGRGDDLQGAHFCGTNVGTMGICMMGTYSTVQPTDESVSILEQLLAWKCCNRDIDPEDFEFHPNSGLNLFNISGHRDGCSTACPGDSLYARLPLIRTNVRDTIDACIPSSIFEQTEPSSIVKIFPNPAREVLHIQLAPHIGNDTQLQLSDPLGRLMWQSEESYMGGELISLPVEGWTAGWYTLQVNGSIRKVLIQ